MINMQDKSMIFTLNGEILITTKGSELCFTDFDTEDGESESGHGETYLEVIFLNKAFVCRENNIWARNDAGL